MPRGTSAGLQTMLLCKCRGDVCRYLRVTADGVLRRGTCRLLTGQYTLVFCILKARLSQKIELPLVGRQAQHRACLGYWASRSLLRIPSQKRIGVDPYAYGLGQLLNPPKICRSPRPAGRNARHSPPADLI